MLGAWGRTSTDRLANTASEMGHRTVARRDGPARGRLCARVGWRVPSAGLLPLLFLHRDAPGGSRCVNLADAGDGLLLRVVKTADGGAQTGSWHVAEPGCWRVGGLAPAVLESSTVPEASTAIQPSSNSRASCTSKDCDSARPPEHPRIVQRTLIDISRPPRKCSTFRPYRAPEPKPSQRPPVQATRRADPQRPRTQ